MTTVRFPVVLMCLAGMHVIESRATAALVFTPTTETSFAPADPPTAAANFPLVNVNNLLNGRTGVGSLGNFAQEATGGLAVLTNGLVPPTIIRGQAANPTGFNYADFATAGNTGGTTVTYNLAGPSTITSIQTYGGWQDSGRDQQNYVVQFSTNGTDFTTFGTVDFNPAGVPAGRPNATRVTLTSTGDTLTDVVALRFNFGTTENGYSGYDELVAYGTVVPEPTSLGLLGLGSLGLLARRRRGH